MYSPISYHNATPQFSTYQIETFGPPETFGFEFLKVDLRFFDSYLVIEGRGKLANANELADMCPVVGGGCDLVGVVFEKKRPVHQYCRLERFEICECNE